MTKRALHQHVWFRVLIGISLLAGLVVWIGLDALRAVLVDFDPLLYSLAVGLLFTHFLIQSIMLRLLLRPQGLPVRARHIFRVTVISHFFGVFLPGGVGPDVVLCYNMARSTEKKDLVLSAVVFIRIAVLFVMAIMAFMASFQPVLARPEIRVLTGGVLLAFCAYYVLMANRHSLALARRLLDFLNRHRVTSMLYKVYFALAAFGAERKNWLRIGPFLVATACIKIVTDYVIARSLGIDIPVWYFFAFIPIITVVAAVPVSFAGLGVREGSFIGLFALVGVAAEEALAISLVSFTLVLVIALVGAVLYVCGGADVIKREDQADGP